MCWLPGTDRQGHKKRDVLITHQALPPSKRLGSLTQHRHLSGVPCPLLENLASQTGQLVHSFTQDRTSGGWKRNSGYGSITTSVNQAPKFLGQVAKKPELLAAPIVGAPRP